MRRLTTLSASYSVRRRVTEPEQRWGALRNTDRKMGLALSTH